MYWSWIWVKVVSKDICRSLNFFSVFLLHKTLWLFLFHLFSLFALSQNLLLNFWDRFYWHLNLLFRFFLLFVFFSFIMINSGLHLIIFFFSRFLHLRIWIFFDWLHILNFFDGVYLLLLWHFSTGILMCFSKDIFSFMNVYLQLRSNVLSYFINLVVWLIQIFIGDNRLDSSL